MKRFLDAEYVGQKGSDAVRRTVLVISTLAIAAQLLGGVSQAAAGPAAAPPASDPSRPLGLHPKVYAAADALGMVRGVGPAQIASSVIVTSYDGSGTWDGRKIKFRHEFVYAPYAAARIATKPDGGGTTMIAVVRDGRAWNESSPGIDPVDVKSGAERRMADIYLTPHGAVRSAVTAAAGSVVVSETAGATVLTLPVSIGTLRVQLDGDNRPARVDLKFAKGHRTLSAMYGGYKDYNHYGVFAPSSIVREENGKRVGELTVAAFSENPYVIVPTPEALRDAAVAHEH
jgi:hypothetical protein